MKILHTGDWHIGKKLNQQDLIEDQRYVLKQLVTYIKNNEIDLVVIAGDIFDVSQPSKHALDLVNETLRIINIELKTPVFMISGNHDSKSRLKYGSEWFKHTNMHVNTDLASCFEPITMNEVNFYLIPYIEIYEAKRFFNEDINSHQDVYHAINTRIEQSLDKSKKNICIGHLFIQNGIQSDSERELSIGLNELVFSETFSMFDAVLLGHLHHPFAISHHSIFYSGSLLKYSFSEVKQPKGFRVLETDSLISTFIPLEPKRDCIFVKATFDEVMNQPLNIDNNAYIKFELSNLDHVIDPMAKIKTKYPNTLELRREVKTGESNFDDIKIKHTSDVSIISQFYKEVTGSEMSDLKKEFVQNLFEGEPL